MKAVFCITRSLRPRYWSLCAWLCLACGSGGASERPLEQVGTIESAVVPDGSRGARADQFARGTDNKLWRRYSEARYDRDWQYLGDRGVALKTDPAVASWGPGRSDVFVINKNNTVDHGVQGEGGQFSWVDNWGSPVPGKELKSIEVSSGRSGLLDVFVVDVSPGTGYSSVWHRRWDNGADTGWKVLAAAGGPGVISGITAAGGTLFEDSFDLFLTGWNQSASRYQLYHAYSDDGGANVSAWESLGEPGGAVIGAPDAASWASGRIDVVVSDANGDIRHLYTNDLSNWAWNTWPAPKVNSSPSIVAMGVDKLRVSARAASDNSLLRCSWEGADLGCTNLGGVLLGSPDASSWSSPACNSNMQCSGKLVCVDKACVEPLWPSMGDYSFDREAPADWAEQWTNDLQGAAHNASHWYFTNMQSIIKIPFNDDITRYGGDREDRGPVFDVPGFHYGDPSYYRDVSRAVDPAGHEGLFVPIETQKSWPYYTYVALFTPDLGKWWTYHIPIPGIVYNNLAWLAVNRADGLLYLPRTYSNLTQIDAYRIIWPENGANFSLSWMKTIQLKDKSGNPLPAGSGLLRAVQGGEFSKNGHLYLVNDDCSNSNNGGIFAFDTNGYLQGRIAVPYTAPGCDTTLGLGDELEGLDITDNNHLYGNLHLVKVDNHIGDDAFYFQHIRLNPWAEPKL